VALDPIGRLDPGQAQERRREVHEAHQPIARPARRVVGRGQVPVLLGKAHDDRHVQPGVVRPPLTPRHARAVVAVEEDDRVAAEPGFLQLLEALARQGVHLRDLVVVLGPVVAHLGRVGMVGRHAGLGRVVFEGVRAHPDLAFVAHRDVEDGKERLPRPAVLPVGPHRRVVPHLARLLEVVVLLVVVRAVVAALAEQLRIHPHPRRHGHQAPHVLGARARGVNARDDGRAGRGADRGVAPGVQVAQPLGRQPVQVGRLGIRVAVAAQLRPRVLAGDPEDVRPVRSGAAVGAQDLEDHGGRGEHGEAKALCRHACPSEGADPR